MPYTFGVQNHSQQAKSLNSDHEKTQLMQITSTIPIISSKNVTQLWQVLETIYMPCQNSDVLYRYESGMLRSSNHCGLGEGSCASAASHGMCLGQHAECCTRVATGSFQTDTRHNSGWLRATGVDCADVSSTARNIAIAGGGTASECCTDGIGTTETDSVASG